MPLNPSGAISLGGPVTGQSIAVELGLSPTASISLNQTNVRTLAGVPSGTIIMPTNFYGKSSWQPTQQGIVAFGIPGTSFTDPVFNGRQLITNTGIVGSTAATSGPARSYDMGTIYGGDKGILGSGRAPGVTAFNVVNLVSNTGAVAAATTVLGTATGQRAATQYGGASGTAIFAFGNPSTPGVLITNISNLISNTGVVASNSPGVGTARRQLCGVNFGSQFAQGVCFGGIGPSAVLNTTNYISTAGVVGSDTPSSLAGRRSSSSCTYGNDRGVFYNGQGSPSRINALNYISNTGVFSANTPTTTPTARQNASGVGFGGDKGILMYGDAPGGASQGTNVISNTGVMAATITYSTAPETRRNAGMAAGFSYT